MKKNWKAWLALGFLAALIYFVGWHTDRFLSDFWPLDRSIVGPNLVASVVQYALVVIAVALLYPPARRAIERFATKHVDELKAHVSAEHKKIHDRLDRSHQRQDALFAHIDKIHTHLGITHNQEDQPSD